jgi:hypothetical protein
MDPGICREELDLEVMAPRLENLVQEPAISQKGAISPESNAGKPELPSSLDHLEEIAPEERLAARKGDALARLGRGAHRRQDFCLASACKTTSSNRAVPALEIAPGAHKDFMERNHTGIAK